MTGNVPRTAATTISFTDPEGTEIDYSELEGGRVCHDQNMEGGSNKEEQATETKKRGEKPKVTAIHIDQQYLDYLKEIGKRMDETSNDSDRMFLPSLLPAMKQLSPLEKMDLGSRCKKCFEEN
jgi:hypothetical protein